MAATDKITAAAAAAAGAIHGGRREANAARNQFARPSGRGRGGEGGGSVFFFHFLFTRSYTRGSRPKRCRNHDDRYRIKSLLLLRWFEKINSSRCFRSGFHWRTPSFSGRFPSVIVIVKPRRDVPVKIIENE